MRILDGAKILHESGDSESSLYGTMLSLNDQFFGSRSMLGSDLRV